MKPRPTRIAIPICLSIVAAFAGLALPASSFEAEQSGQIATLPPIGVHWVWIPDRILEHSLLFDGDRGEMLGSISSASTLTPKLPMISKSRGEIYSVDLDYARGRRGKRTDYVTIYDDRTLDVVGEVVLPHPTSESNTSLHHATLLDDDRFLVVFSQFPITVATVVDLEKRKVVSEVSLAGCAGVYATGPTAFATLCGDGTVAATSLDDSGGFRQMTRSDPFFNVVKDPVSMAGVRNGPIWSFVSFKGSVHELDFSFDVSDASDASDSSDTTDASNKPIVRTAWWLIDDADRAANWRPGGTQPLALHRSSKRLFALMHQGGDGTHKAPGPEIWSFDVESHERIARIEVPNLAADFLGPLFGLDSESFAQRILRRLIPNDGAHSLVVTQDSSPLLFTRNAEFGVVAILDAESGEHLRNLNEIGITGPTLGVP